MNDIKVYLDAMFSAYHSTPRLESAKAELQTMMEDAYAVHLARGSTPNEAIVQTVAGFGSLEELAQTLGISDDLSTQYRGQVAPPSEVVAPQYPPLTMMEVQAFVETHRAAARRQAIGISLYAVALIPLMIAIGIGDLSGLPVLGGTIIGIGFVAAGLIAAIASMILVGASRPLAEFSRLSDGRFSSQRDAVDWINAAAQTHQQRATWSFMIAVVLWVLSPIALLVIALAPPTPLQSLWIGIGLAIFLALAAIGLYLWLSEAGPNKAAETINRGIDQRPVARR